MPLPGKPMAETKTKIDLKGPFAWAKGKEAVALAQALGPENIRFVGGAVRDSLLGKKVADIDVAASLFPEEVMKKLGKGKFKVVPTGLKHGTVMAILHGRTFEVTTLRHDVKTHGRHADVAFHADWKADAKRRDFTINALYLSPDGTLFDFFGGVEDLKAGRVRFIGSAENRIKEDGLRILRLFRFHAWYGKGDLDREAVAAIRENLDMINHLSAERVRAEILKTLKAPDPVFEFRAMQETGVLGRTFPRFSSNLVGLEEMTTLEKILGMPSAIRRLGALFKGQCGAISRHLKLSNKVHDRLSKLEKPPPTSFSEKSIHAEVYREGLQSFEDRLLFSGIEISTLKKVLKIAREFEVPTFPVTGKDLQGRGISPGIGMGVKLQELEQRWIESDFKLTKKELLEF